MDSKQYTPILPRLLTKLSPPRFKKNMLPRNRLVEFLVENIDVKLVIITAPAGYGKTTVLSDYANRRVRPCAWLSFDESDRDPVVFIENLVLAISRVFPQLIDSPQFVLNLTQTLLNQASGPEACSRLLVNQIYSTIPDAFDLVLDDYQIVEDQPQLNPLISALLNNLPDSCRVLLSCRAVAALELTQLVLQSNVVGIGVNELKMTDGEVYTLLSELHRLPITEEKASELTQQSEGWITGVLLDGSISRNQPGFRPDYLRDTNHREQLFNYMASQILERQSPELQTFLLESSVLEYMQADICNQLLGINNSTANLRECEVKRLFIISMETDGPDNQRTNRPAFYRYHNLFRDFLLTTLRLKNEARYLELEKTCAAFFKEQGDIVRAMPHFARAEDYPAIIDILLSVNEIEIKAGHAETLKGWLDMLPASVLEARSDLQLIKIQVLGLLGCLPEAYFLVTRLRQALVEQLPQSRLKLAQAIMQHGRLLRIETRYEAAAEILTDSLNILSRIQEEMPLIASGAEYAATKAANLLELGVCTGMNGQFSLSLEVLQEAEIIYGQLEAKEELAQVHHCLSLVYTGLGDNQNRQQQLEISLKFWEETGNLQGQVKSLINMAALYLAQEKYQMVEETLELARARADKSGSFSGQAHTLLYRANLLRCTNHFPEAYKCYKQAQELAERANENRLAVLIQAELVATLRILENYTQAQVTLNQAQNALIKLKGDSGLIINLLTLAQIGLDLDQGYLEAAQKGLEACANYFTPDEHKRELCQKRFLDARLYFAQERYKLSLEGLEASLNFSLELDNQQVIYHEALHARSLLQFAQARLGRKPAIQDTLQRLLNRLPEQEATPVSAQAKKLDNSVRKTASVDEGAVQGSGGVLMPFPVTRSVTQPLVLNALGLSQVLVHGVKVSDWRTAKAMELLFLLADKGKPLHKELLIETLWPDLLSSQGDGLLKSTVYRLRNALSPEWVKWENGAYLLSVDYWYDAGQFETLARLGNKTNSNIWPDLAPRAIELYNQALSLYRGYYLGGLYSEWIMQRNENLAALFIETLLKKAELELRLAMPEAALLSVNRCLETEPCNETAHMLRLRIHQKNGDATQLRQSYNAYCQVILQELNLKPSQEITSFYQLCNSQFIA